jgi:glycosyltransferase involved in cell wall biosynthesis
MQNVCLVVPCCNEERRLDRPAFERFLESCPQLSYCFVNDGSQDQTLAVLQAIAAAHEGKVQVLDLPSNVGKAEAVRRGMLQAHAWKAFEYIGYWDADLATPLEELPSICRIAQKTECLMVLGSRIKRLGSTIDRQARRHYLGRVFATFASLVLRLPVYDTQCGAKLVQAAIVPELFREPFLSRWIFDVEVLARLRNLVGVPQLLSGAVEAPLTTWREVGGSKLKLSHMLRAPLELWRIGRRYNRSSRDR